MKIPNAVWASPSIATIAFMMLATVVFWLSLPLWAGHLFGDNQLDRIEAKIDNLYHRR